MCPHVSVTLVSTGQLRPWGDSYSILIYEFVCMCPHVSVTLVNFVHGVIASILIYEFVCMCPHASVTLVSTGQLRPWGDS